MEHSAKGTSLVQVMKTASREGKKNTLKNYENIPGVNADGLMEPIPVFKIVRKWLQENENSDSLGEEINKGDRNGLSPLHYACSLTPSYEACKILLEYGADVNNKDEIGQTPLHKAVCNHMFHINQTSLHTSEELALRICSLLLEYGAQVNACDLKRMQNPLRAFEKTFQTTYPEKGEVTPLHLAVGFERFGSRICRILLQSGANPNATDCNGKTPLHFAAVSPANFRFSFLKESMLEVCTLLVKAGASVDTAVDSPVVSAFHYGKETVKVLLEAGIPYELKDLEKYLHLICRWGLVDLLEQLIAIGISLETRESKNAVSRTRSYRVHGGNALLHTAAKYNQLEIAKLLLESGANIEVGTEAWPRTGCLRGPGDEEHNETPLHLACCDGQEDMVNFLINQGANVNAMTTYGRSVVEYLMNEYRGKAENIMDNILRLLVKNGVSLNSTIYAAVKRDSINDVKFVYDNFIDIKKDYGCVLEGLRTACEEGFNNIAIFLLNACEEAKHLFDDWLETKNDIFLLACESSSMEKFVSRILQYGVNVNATNYKGETALHIAILSENDEMVFTLLKNDADVNAITHEGESPLFFASGPKTVKGTDERLHYQSDRRMIEMRNRRNRRMFERRKLKTGIERRIIIIKKILSLGADIDQERKDGITPLHAACMENEKDVIELLLSKGANFDRKLPEGETPFGVVASKLAKPSVNRSDEYMATIQTIKLFLSMGASINLEFANSFKTLKTILINHVYKFVGMIRNGNYNGLNAAREICSLLSKADIDPNMSIAADGTTFFSSACSICTDLEVIELLLAKGADVNASNRDGMTPLLWACNMPEKGNHLLRYLVENGASISATGRNGDTGLHILCRKPWGTNMEGLSYLCQKGLDMTHPNHDMVSPLTLAFDNTNDPQQITLLLQNTTFQNEHEFNKIMVEATATYGLRKKKDVIKFLFSKHEFNVNTKLSDGETLLNSFIKCRALDLVSLILAKGANINLKGKDGNSALHVAYELSMVELLLLKKANACTVNDCSESTLFSFLNNARGIKFEEFQKVVQLLSNAGCSFSAVDQHGRTPLHAFCENYGNTESREAKLSYLLSKNVDACAVDSNGDGPITLLVATKGNANYTGDILDIFLSHISSAHVKKLFGQQLKKGLVKYIARDSNWDTEFVKQAIREELLDANESLGGKYLLNESIRRRDFELIEFLLDEQSADVNIRDSDGKVPLEYAYKSEIICKLLDFGARADIAGIRSGRLLQVGIVYNDVGVIQKLLSAGADVNDPTSILKPRSSFNRFNSSSKSPGTHVTPLYYALEYFRAKNSNKLTIDNIKKRNVEYTEYTEDVLHILLQNGADVNAAIFINGLVETPLHSAARTSSLSLNLIEKLREASDLGNIVQAIGIAYKYENTKCARLLVSNTFIHGEKNLDIKLVSKMIVTVCRFDFETLRLLIKNGIDIKSAQDKQGYTPLHCAIFYLAHDKATVEAGLEIIQYLLAHGARADINKATKGGDSSDRYMIYLEDCTKNQTPLHVLICARSLNDGMLSDNIAKLLLENGADVCAKDANNATALHYICNQGYSDQRTPIIKTLLKYGAHSEINSRTLRDGESPTHLLLQNFKYHRCRQSFLEDLSLMLKKGADPCLQNINGDTLLHLCGKRIASQYKGMASQDNDKQDVVHKCCKLLLKYGADLAINTQNSDGQTPLHCIFGQDTSYSNKVAVDLIRILIQNGADPNIRDNKGQTPLHIFTGNDTKQWQYLLDKGAINSINVKDGAGKTPLRCLWRRDDRYIGIDRHYLRHGVDGTLSLIQLLVMNGANINTTDEKGRTPLHYSCEEYSLPIVEQLLKLGASIDVRDNDGRTLLHYCVQRGNIDVVDHLIKQAGANVNARDNQGDTPLHLASHNCVSLLVQNGADVFAKNEMGELPLSANADLHVEFEQKRRAEVAEFLAAEENLKNTDWGRSKLMLIGEGGAGKSATLNSLLGNPFNEKWDSTIGINLTKTETKNWREKSKTNFDFTVESFAKSIMNKSRTTVPVVFSSPEVKKITRNGIRASLGKQEITAVASAATIETKKILTKATAITESASVAIISQQTINKRERRMNEEELKLKRLGNFALAKLQFADKEEEDSIEFSIWDFGGQEVFYTLHHLFLTQKGAYVAVFNMERIERETESALHFLEFWLKSICLHAPNAPVFLVGTFWDTFKKLEIVERIFEENNVLKMHPRIVANKERQLTFFPINNVTGEGAEMIREVTEKVVEREDYVHEKVSINWIKCLDEIMADESRSYLERRAVDEMAANFSVEDTDKMLSYFHELGMIMYFSATEELRRIVVTNPQWILHAIGRVIHDKRLHSFHLDFEAVELQQDIELLHECGIATRDLLEFLWKDTKQIDFLIDLMRKTLLLTEWKFHADKQEAYLVPSMLPSEFSKRESDKDFIGHVDIYGSSTNLKLRIDFEYLPTGVFERLVGLLVAYSVSKTTSTTEPYLSREKAIIFMGSNDMFMELQLKENSISGGLSHPKFLSVLRSTVGKIQANFMSNILYRFLLHTNKHGWLTEEDVYQKQISQWQWKDAVDKQDINQISLEEFLDRL